MESIFYYTAFFVLGISILFNGFLVIVSVVQLITIKGKADMDGAYTFVLLQMLQGTVVLAIGIPLLLYLRDGAVESWVMWIAATLLSLLEMAARRYRSHRFGRDGKFG